MKTRSSAKDKLNKAELLAKLKEKVATGSNIVRRTVGARLLQMKKDDLINQDEYNFVMGVEVSD